MWTADNLTDDAIRKLGAASRDSDWGTAMWCDYALVTPEQAVRYFIPTGCDRSTARARVAQILNERAAGSR